MFTKLHYLRCLLNMALALILGFGLLPTPVQAQGSTPTQPGPAFVVSFAAHPSGIDANWPVTKIETVSLSDPLTGSSYQVTVETRTGPKGLRTGPNVLPCELSSQKSSTGAAAATCTFWQAQSRTVHDAHISGLAAHTTSYVDIYQQYAMSNLYRTTRVEVWYTRLNSNWSVLNWATQVGCSVCERCNGGNETLYTWGSQPTQWTGNTSQTWMTVFYATQPARPLPDAGFLIVARNQANAYETVGSRTFYRGQTSTAADWP